ncbi:TIGR03809 family protein [Bradyrhizobium sp.]|uniref:TIGR03809 family protein n=1 Tax=Bradyrhizobium sp. TaxID=376 RepID=UPI0039E5E15A
MTHRHCETFSRDIAARWCTLAEQRLEHLSEMFETGRWRRYHSEIAFLENIQEAKRAVQTWRALATGGDVAAAAATVKSAFGWSPATMPRVAPRELAQTMQPKAVHIEPETIVPVTLDPVPDALADVTEIPIAPLAKPDPVAALLAELSSPAAETVAEPEGMVEFTFNLDGLEARYPLLRNAF